MEPLVLKSGGDNDDSPATIKVKTPLREFFSVRELRAPSGESPAAVIAEALLRKGRNVETGAADFLRWYGNNLRDAPCSWNAMVASFDRWIAKPSCGDVGQIRNGH